MSESVWMEFRALSLRPKIISNATRGVIKSTLATKWLYPQTLNGDFPQKELVWKWMGRMDSFAWGLRCTQGLLYVGETMNKAQNILIS